VRVCVCVCLCVCVSMCVYVCVCVANSQADCSETIKLWLETFGWD